MMFKTYRITFIPTGRQWVNSWLSPASAIQECMLFGTGTRDPKEFKVEEVLWSGGDHDKPETWQWEYKAIA